MVQSLRLQIAEAQIALRTLKADLAEAEASIKKATITAAGSMKALGGSDPERKAALDQAVADSPACRKYQREIINAEGALLRLEAAQADQQDEAQRGRWQVRARLCDALEALAMAQPAGFFSGGEVERAAENVFDTMVSATVKSGMEAAADAATAPGDAQVLYNTGRHVVAVRGPSPLAAAIPAMDQYLELDAAVNAEVTPRGRAGAQAYRAEAARRGRTIADEQADELFGD